MSLKTEFLQKFTKELLINSLSPQYLEEIKKRRKKEIQRIKQETIQLTEQEEDLYPSIMNSENNNQPQFFSNEQRNKRVIENSENSGYYGKLYLGKIIPFVTDPQVSSIDCPGPGKFISVKKMGRVIITKTILDKENIQEIINSFSEESKIPLIGGVFKAIVNNLVITSIDSISGPRFILSKTMPNPSEFL